MIKIFLVFFVLINLSCCRYYVLIEEQHGLKEPLSSIDEKTITKIDTVYSSAGGVVKVVKHYVRIKNKRDLSNY